MVMFFDLKQVFYGIADQLRDGKVKVVGVHDYGDKIILVVCPVGTANFKQVTVVDTTREPMEPQVLEVEAVEDIETVAELPTVTPAPEVAPCRYCGKLFSKRGLTRHENKCDGEATEED